MSVAKYLVTGGAGFIGSNIVAALAAAGERVRVYDDLSTGFFENLDGIPNQSLVERVRGDIRDVAALASAMKGVEVVFHQAALGSVPRSVENPIESDSVNTGGTLRVLDAARLAGARRVIFAASSSAYGETVTLPKHEDQTPMPLSPYAVTKLAGEQYVSVYASLYGLETIALRYFNVFGPNQSPEGAYAAAIPRFVTAALENRPITIYGDGEQTRDFCFIENAVSANLLAATTSNKLAGQVVNIAGGRRVSLNELCRALQGPLGSSVKVEHVAPRPGDIRHSLADVTRAFELIGYQPKVTWEEGLAPTIAYLRGLMRDGRSTASATVQPIATRNAAIVTAASGGAKRPRAVTGSPESQSLSVEAR